MVLYDAVLVSVSVLFSPSMYMYLDDVKLGLSS